MIAIRQQLLRRLLLGLFLVLGGCGAGVYLLLRELLIAQFDDGLQAKASVLAALVEEKRGGLALEDEANMPDFAPGPAPEYFSMALAGGGVFARSASLGERDLPALQAGDATARFGDMPLPDGRRGRLVALRAPVPLEHHEGRPAPPLRHVMVLVARERESLDGALGRVSAILAVAGALLLFGVPLVVRRVVRNGLRPLDRLADQAARIDAQLLDTRFPTSGLPDELLPICTRLNDLLGRLAQSFERERRFSADVAHELRTPLAELRSSAEVALRFPEGGAVPALEDILGATVQMERLVSTLLMLSRCEAGREPVALERIDLGRFVDEAWTAVAAGARAKALTVRAAPPAVATVAADRVLLGAIVANLLANAVEYAPAGGELAWEVSGGDGTVTLAMSNSNATLAPEDVAHVFEPFWRRDPARSGGAHSGLGLSLSRALARLQGGDLALDLVHDRVAVRLRLPAPAANAE